MSILHRGEKLLKHEHQIFGSVFLGAGGAKVSVRVEVVFRQDPAHLSFRFQVFEKEEEDG
jgi:hypothetical protein